MVSGESRVVVLTETPDAPFAPAASWANVGVATWADAVQTLFWAKARKDTNVLAKTVIWDPALKAGLEAQLAAAPNSVRQRFGSVEGLLRDWWFNYMASVDSYRVIAQSGFAHIGTIADDNGSILVEAQHEDGRIPMQFNLVLHRDNEGWGVVFVLDLGVAMTEYLRSSCASNLADDHH